MKTRCLVLSCAIAAAVCISTTSALGKTASCPCSPCKCSPCTCGGGGSKGGKHHKKEGGEGHTGVGVDANVDFGGVGHRNAEPNPFAAGSEDKPVAHTEEKRTTKRREHEPTTSNFDEIKLTGKEAKGENDRPNTFNVDNEEAPKLPPTGVLTKEKPKEVAKEELRKAHDAYDYARSEWLKKQPNWNSLVHDWTQSSSTEEGIKKSAKAKKKIDKMIDQFDGGDGKQLVDDWKKAFDSALKSGATVDDNGLVPPPKDDIEKKKYAVIKAQNNLDHAKELYDWTRQTGANRDEGVQKVQNALSDSTLSTSDPKYKAALADLDKAINEAGVKWAATDEGKEQAKKVHDAEKELDKAKEAWKPFEKYEEKQSASNP